MDSSTIIALATALAALIGAASPIIVSLIQSKKDKSEKINGIYVPSSYVLHSPKTQIRWFAVLSFSFLCGVIGYGGATIENLNVPDEISPTPSQRATMIMSPTPQKVKLGELLFQEDFNGNVNQWPTGTDNNGTYFMENGEYHVVGPEDNVSGVKWLAQFKEPEKIYTDFYLETKVRYIEGSQKDDAYGVLFRSLNSSTYVFAINNKEQTYSLHTDKTTLLWWTYSPKIVKDGINVIGILCDGNDITIFINGYEVDSVQSDYQNSGGIGLDFASKVHVAFDYIYVWELSK